MAEHSTITDPNIHEPKGVAASASGKVYRSDGAGSGEWYFATPCGNFHYTNLASASTMSLTTSYAKLNDASMSANMVTDGLSVEVTYADGRLTYTGALTRQWHVVMNTSIDQSSGAARDVDFAIYKNGVIIDHAEMVQTTANGDKMSSALHANVPLATGDYLEVYAKASASITLNIYNIYFFAMGMMNA